MQQAERKPNLQNVRQILVELEVTDVLNDTFSFVTNKELEKATRIISVESYYADIVPLTPTAKTVVAKAIHDKAFIKLCDSSATTLRTVPLPNLAVAGARTSIVPLNLESFDMQQSSVRVATSAGLVAGTKFLFLFTYEKPKEVTGK